MIGAGKFGWCTGIEGVTIPVLDHSSGVDLRGRTIQVTVTRDFRSLTPEVVEKLNAKWTDYGTVWTGVAESDTLTFRMNPGWGFAVLRRWRSRSHTSNVLSRQ